MKFTNPMRETEGLDSEDENSPSVDEEQGRTQIVVKKTMAPHQGGSTSQAEPEGLSAEEILDLTAAFEACDLDSGGTIDCDELVAMMAVFGATIDMQGIVALIAKEKTGFKDVVEEGQGGMLSPLKRFNPMRLSTFSSTGVDLMRETEDELNLAEFIHMMTSPDVEAMFPNGWEEGAYHMRLLKNAYATADLNGDNELEFDELEVAVNSLVRHACTASVWWLVSWVLTAAWCTRTAHRQPVRQ